MTFFLSGFIFAVLLGTSLRVACSGFILTNMASRFETPFKSFTAEGPDLSYDFLKEFFVDSVRAFEEVVSTKIRSINLPRRSFMRPERSIALEGVHVSVFIESFGKKFQGREILHSAGEDKLQYEVHSLNRWLALVGGGSSSVVRKNDACDWSLLTPLGYLASVGPDPDALPKGALVVPLREDGDQVSVFRPLADEDNRELFGRSK